MWLSKADFWHFFSSREWFKLLDVPTLMDKSTICFFIFQACIIHQQTGLKYHPKILCYNFGKLFHVDS